ncbi:MAG TPA: helix-turn-helix domain-containing protein [Roseiflexaceae bacterium]|nr:helix-turn-helix domain-containing protein [Roseiflexaceae bacterium]
MVETKLQAEPESNSRRERARQAKRRRIARAAAELFHERGFDATTVEQIAERADVAKGTVFLYAKTKARLLLLVYEAEIGDAVAEALRAIQPDAPILETLVGLFGRFFQLYERDIDLARRFVQELVLTAPDADGQVISTTAEFLAWLAALIRGWQAAGRVETDVDALLAARTTFALYYAALLGWLSGQIPDTQARDELLAKSFALHWRGLMIEPR